MPYYQIVEASDADKAIAALVRRLADPVPEVADVALEALLAFGNRASGPVAAACGDADAERATRALLWVTRRASELDTAPWTEIVTGALQGPDGTIRAKAIEALVALLQAARDSSPAPPVDGQWESALAILCSAIADPDPLVRLAAANALGTLNATPPDAVSNLVMALNDNSSRAVREAAARALGKLAAGGLAQP